MTTLTIPLVGSHFRPMAKPILAILPIDHPLELKAEPDNAYDPNAVAVIVDMTEWPESKMNLLQEMIGGDMDAEYVCKQMGQIHLGYLARTGNKTARGGPGNAEALLLASSNDWGFMGLDAK